MEASINLMYIALKLQTMAETKQISATIQLETVERIAYWSGEEKRTFSQMVEILLSEALDKRDKAANRKTRKLVK